MKSAGSISTKDTEISFTEQQKINTFSRLNMKSEFLKEEIKKVKEEMNKLEDAGTAIEESFGEDLKLFVGECLVDVDEDAATKYHERMMEEKEAELEKLGDELDEVEQEMKGLKSFLYARFGSQINLDMN